MPDRELDELAGFATPTGPSVDPELDRIAGFAPAKVKPTGYVDEELDAIAGFKNEPVIDEELDAIAGITRIERKPKTELQKVMGSVVDTLTSPGRVKNLAYGMRKIERAIKEPIDNAVEMKLSELAESPSYQESLKNIKEKHPAAFGVAPFLLREGGAKSTLIPEPKKREAWEAALPPSARAPMESYRLTGTTPAATVLGTLSWPIRKAFEGTGGFLKGTQDALKQAVLGVPTSPIGPEMTREEFIKSLIEKPFVEAARSLREEPGAATGIGDVNAAALREILGKYYGPEWERVAQTLGLFQELAIPLPGSKITPKYEKLGKQISSATGRPLSEATEAAKMIMEYETHPERLAQAIDLVEHVGGKKAVEKFIRMVGPEGEKLGVGGMRGVLTPAGKPEDIGKGIMPPGTTVPGVPLDIRKMASEASWGAGLPPGAKDLFREHLAAVGTKSADVPTLAEQIRKGFGKRGEEWMIMRDMKSQLNKLDEYRAKALAGDVEAAQKLPAVEQSFNKYMNAASDRLGAKIDEGTVRAGFQYKGDAKQIAREMQTDVALKEFLDNMAKEANEAGVSFAKIEDYVPRIETKESKSFFGKFWSGKKRSGGAHKQPWQRHRNDLVGLLGESPHEFILDPSAIAMRYKGHIVAVEAARAEEKILRAYGKEIPKEWLNTEGNLNKLGRAEMERQGLAEYSPVVNDRIKGKKYVLDPIVSEMLHNITDPEKASKLFPIASSVYNKIMSSWKTGATLFRPGFVNRNLISNSVTYWVHGGGMKELEEAMKSVASYNKSKKKILPIKGEHKVLNPSEAAIISEAEKHAVLGEGLVSTELNPAKIGKTTIAQRLNPFSTEFAHVPLMRDLNSYIEDTFRLALFKTLRNRGFAPQEAAQRVALAYVNYPEISKTGKAIRSALPFYRWTSGNIAQQIWNHLEVPGKMAKQYRLLGKVQDIDKPTQEERELRELIPEKEYKGTTILPFARGEHGERSELHLGGLLPVYGLNQLAAPIRTVREMMGPAPALAMDILAQPSSADVPIPLAPFSSPTRASEAYRKMDRASESLIDSLGKFPKVKQFIMDSLGIVPDRDNFAYATNLATGREEAQKKGLSGEAANKYAQEYAESYTPALGYKWKGVVPDIINRIDPRIGTIMRTSRYTNEQLYDTIVALLSGVKAFPWGKSQALEEIVNELDEAKKEIESAKRKEEASGTMIPGWFKRM